MTVPALKLGQIASPEGLEDCCPNLMPFKINYTGPAPISTYFIVAPDTNIGPQPNNEPVDASVLPLSAEATTNDDHATQQSVGADQDASLDAPTKADPSTDAFQSQLKKSIINFVSSFRGRTVRGTTVELPVGYTGVVFTADAPISKVPAKTKDKSTTRQRVKRVFTKEKGGRRTSRRNVIEPDEDEDAPMDVDVDDGPPADIPDEPQEPVLSKTLQPVSQFSSFVLWNPDIPVDDGRDEYLRSLKEWTKLAEVIHSIDD